MKILQKKIRSVDYFTLLDLSSINIGSTIAFDVFIKKDNGYIIIIEAGTTISQTMHDKLEKQDYLYISNEDKEKLSLTCKSLRYYIRHNRDNLKKRVEILHELNNKLFNEYLNSQSNIIDLECVNSIIKSIIYLANYDKIFLKNTMPYFINEHDLPNHSLNVATYAINLGNKLKLNQEALILLGTAGLLHDVGLKKIPPSLINKVDKLNLSELEKIHKHPQFSVEIIEQNNIHNPYIIDAISHHHENYDGSGYPNQLSKNSISIYASIISICDVFDALTSNRPHRKQYSSFDAIKMMLKDSSMANKFNNKYLQILLQSL